MAYLQIDETTDKPVEVVTDGDRIRIRYGSGARISLDTDEALDLAVGVVHALAVIDPAPTDPLDPMQSVKASGLLGYIAAVRRDLASLTGEANSWIRKGSR